MVANGVIDGESICELVFERRGETKFEIYFTLCIV